MIPWDAFPGPWDNPDIHRPYQAASAEEKVFNKLELQEIWNLPLSDTVPLVASDGPVPPPAQRIQLLRADSTAAMSMVLAGCDILVSPDPALRRLARRYGTCPAENEGELAQALQIYEDRDVWAVLVRRLLEQAEM